MADTEKKQQYLQTYILQPGHNPNDFIEFLASQKFNGGQLDEWDYHELKLAVKLYVEKHPLPGPVNPDVEVVKKPEVIQQPVVDEKKDKLYDPLQIDDDDYDPLSTKNYDDPTPVKQVEEEEHKEVIGQQQPVIQQQTQQPQQAEETDEQKQQKAAQEKEKLKEQFKAAPKKKEFVYKAQCRKVNETVFSKENNIQILLQDYEKKSGGIFSSAYISYKIKTIPFNWEVERRYSDFLSLRTILAKIYPALIVPPVSKKTNTRSFQPLFIHKRMAFLEKFLNKIIKNPELKSNKFVEGFLQMSNPKDWSNLVKEADKIPLPIKLDQQYSVEGTVTSELNENIVRYCNHAGKYYNNTDAIYKKIRQLSKTLIVDFDALSNTLYNIGDCFKSLFQFSAEFNEGIPAEQNKNKLLDDIYVTLHNMSIQWGDAFSAQMKVVQENIGNFFKYYNQEGRSIKDLIKQRDEIYKKYTDQAKKLHDRKEKAFLLQQTQSWDLTVEGQKIPIDVLKADKDLAFQHMFNKDSLTMLDWKQKAGFYSKCLSEELKRVINEKVTEYSSHFVEFGHLQTDNIQLLHVLWADTMTNLEQLGQGGEKLTMLQATMREKRIQSQNDQN